MHDTAQPVRYELSSCPWTCRAAARAEEVPAEIAERGFPAVVPGCVHTDLLRAGLIEHPNLGFNEEKLEWIGRTDWEYRCRFEAEEPLLARAQLELVCEGLDTVATVTLNGHMLGATANMFRTYRFDARPALRAGRNELAIAFRSPVQYVLEQEQRFGKRPNAGNRYPYCYLRKMACNFGWDWGPRVPTAGIWRKLHLHAWSEARLDGVRPLVVQADADRARVEVAVDLVHEDAPGGPHTLAATLRCPDGREISGRARLDPKARHGRVTLEIERPPRWWPRGYGDQPLCPLTVALLDEQDQPLDRWQGRIGLRTIRLRTEPDDSGAAFTLEVNDTPIFCQGANWIPDGLFPAELTPERYRARVAQAAQANMNMLRVWGGGIYEQEAFYEACDEAGLLVWQDFMFACAAYPEEQPLRSEVEAEARDNITRLASHPSVALYCGANECMMIMEIPQFRDALPPGQTWGRYYYLDLLPALVAELDPTRPYWPNSPYSGSPDIPTSDPDRGNRHTWDAMIEGYRALVPRFVTEFGHQGPPCIATLREALPPEQLALGSPAMEHRQRSDSNENRFGRPMAAWFPPVESFADWHYLAQLLQARATSLGLTWWRVHRPRCMGAVFWQLNDCWAGHSWSAIDSMGRRKLLWYAAARAFAPRLLAIHPDHDEPALWASNDTPEPWQTTVRLRRVAFDGRVLAENEVTCNLEPRASRRVADLTERLGPPRHRSAELIVADADGLRETWFFEHDKRLAYPQPDCDATVTAVAGGWRLDVHAHALLRDVAVLAGYAAPDARVDEQLVTLLPGETCSFTIRTAADLRSAKLAEPPVLRCVNPFGMR